MTEALKALLFNIRQHPGYKEFLDTLQPAPMPRFRKGETLEQMGARTVYASGARDQYDRLVALLTGQASQDETNSEQEQL